MSRRVPLRIRPARTDDAAVLTSLARRSKASWGYPEAWLAEWAPQLRFDAGYLAEELVLVAEADADGAGSEVVGVVAVELSDGDPEIGHFWVDPAHQRRGVGQALLDGAKAACRERGVRALRIVSDPHARPFYERMGALHVGEVDAPVAGTSRTLPILRLVV